MTGFVLGAFVTALICLTTTFSWWWVLGFGAIGWFVEFIFRISQGEAVLAVGEQILDVGLMTSEMAEVSAEVVGDCLQGIGDCASGVGEVIGSIGEGIGDVLSNIDVS